MVDKAQFRYLPVCEEHGDLDDPKETLKLAMDVVELHKEEVHTLGDTTVAHLVVDTEEDTAHIYVPGASSSSMTSGAFTTADLGDQVTKRWSKIRFKP